MKNSIILCLVCLFASCGDIFMREKKKAEMQEMMPCKAEPSALLDIAQRDVDSELSCLKESLLTFVEIVKSDRKGSLSYNELTAFMSKNMQSVDRNLYEPLKGIFTLNSLLSGDHSDYIEREQLEKLIDSLRRINRILVDHKVWKILEDDSKISFREHLDRKATLFNAFTLIKNEFIKIYKPNNNSINLSVFVSKFESLDERNLLNRVEDLFFVKKIFLGGDSGELTSKEFAKLLNIMPNAIKIAYDVLYLLNVDSREQDQLAIIETLKESFETIVQNLYYTERDNVALFRIEDIFGLVDKYAPEFSFFKEYKDSILRAKMILLKNASPIFTAQEVIILLDNLILEWLKRGAYFYRAYYQHRDLLNSSSPIKEDLPYLYAVNAKEEQFKKEFNRIARDYVFFPDTNLMAFYDHRIKRSALGMLVVSVLEDLVKKAFYYYAIEDEKAYGGFRMTQRQVERILTDFKEVLRGAGFILPGREINAAETVTLMTSLFQHQSNGQEDDIEVNEMVEFLITLATSYRMTDLTHKHMQAVCETDYRNRFSSQCFQENFSDIWEFDMGGKRTMSSYFPKMSAYLQTLSTGQISTLFERVEFSSRACVVFEDNTPVPFDLADTFLFFGALVNMESTFNRFDVGSANDSSPNNLLDARELRKAYNEVYELAIKAVLPGSVQWRALDVFYYLLDQAKEPSKTYMTFRILPAGYPAKSATRSSVAGVLKVIAEQSEANKINPYPCESLR